MSEIGEDTMIPCCGNTACTHIYLDQMIYIELLITSAINELVYIWQLSMMIIANHCHNSNV